MDTKEEKALFLENGYLVAEDVVTGAHLAELRQEFDRAWEAFGDRGCSMAHLLRFPSFVELIEHPPILHRQRAIFGSQTQLLQADIALQMPGSSVDERAWHWDFYFPGDRPLTVNTLLFLDDMTLEKGPTRVVPGSHRGETMPPADRRAQPLPGEVAVTCSAGAVIFINGAIWHSGGCNRSAGLRRVVYLYYGYWWLKRFDVENPKHTVPWQALEGASEQRLQLLGVKLPDRYLDVFEPGL